VPRSLIAYFAAIAEGQMQQLPADQSTIPKHYILPSAKSCHQPQQAKKSVTPPCLKHTFITYSPLSLLTFIHPVTHPTGQRKAARHSA